MLCWGRVVSNPGSSHPAHLLWWVPPESSLFPCGGQPLSHRRRNVRTAGLGYLPARLQTPLKGLPLRGGGVTSSLMLCQVHTLPPTQLTSGATYKCWQGWKKWLHEGLNQAEVISLVSTVFPTLFKDFISSDTIELIFSFRFGPKPYSFAT